MDTIDQNLSARIEDMKVKMKLEAMSETILNMNAEMKIRFNSVEERLDKLEGRMEKLESRMDNFEGRMDNLEGRMDKLESRMDKLEGRMDKLEGTMDNFKHDIDRKFEQTFELLREIMNKLP